MLISIKENIIPKALLIFMTVSILSFLFVLRIWSNFLNLSIGNISSYFFLKVLKSNSSIIYYLVTLSNIINIWMTVLTAWFLSYITKYLISSSYLSCKLSKIFAYWSFKDRHLSHRNYIYWWFTAVGFFSFLVANAGFGLVGIP